MLLATKLHVPGSHPGLVPRPRLADQLDEGLGRGLILACAPAGYGKTALLADWVRRKSARYARAAILFLASDLATGSTGAGTLRRSLTTIDGWRWTECTDDGYGMA